jgi:hypothetical protein
MAVTEQRVNGIRDCLAAKTVGTVNNHIDIAAADDGFIFGLSVLHLSSPSRIVRVGQHLTGI